MSYFQRGTQCRLLTIPPANLNSVSVAQENLHALNTVNYS